MFRCIFCNKHEENTESEMGKHQAICKHNPYREMRSCTRAEFEDLQAQVKEIHAFVSGLAQALNNPMLKAMLPPQFRGMMGD